MQRPKTQLRPEPALCPSRVDKSWASRSPKDKGLTRQAKVIHRRSRRRNRREIIGKKGVSYLT